MDQITALWTFVRKHKKYFNKYVIAMATFAIIVIFVDENSIIRRISYANETSNLHKEINRYQAEYEECTRRLNELAEDSSALERIAREKYLMKKSNEDIYVFEENIK